ncbi:MAG: hypothetical protein LUI87_02195 [Lachnospiraceae bacterium]|nr:hypothetical protein [Lachnospiraceae bacterium]
MNEKFNSMFGNEFGGQFSFDQETKMVGQKMEIILRKEELTRLLDEMWEIYGKGNIAQLQHYKKQVSYIKETGCKVFRNSQGKHKILT